MTKADLLTALGYRLNKSVSSMDSTTSARLLGFLNQRQRRILSIPGLQHLRFTTTTFPSVASTADYTISSIATVHRITDTTDQRVLYELSQQDYRLIDPNTITGTPEAFVWKNTGNASSVTVTLWPTPAAAVTYTVDADAVISDLSSDSDVPLLPVDFHDLLLLGALADEYQHLSDERYPIAVSEYRQREGQFRYAMAETATGKPFSLSHRRNSGRPSQLGGWYPAGT